MADPNGQESSESVKKTVQEHSYWNALQERCENLSSELRSTLRPWSRSSSRLPLQRFEDAFHQVNTKAVDFSVANKAWIDHCENSPVAPGQPDPAVNELLHHAGKAFWEYHQSLRQLATVVKELPNRSKELQKQVRKFEPFFRDQCYPKLRGERVLFGALSNLANKSSNERPMTLEPGKLLRLMATLERKLGVLQQRRAQRRSFKEFQREIARARSRVPREPATPTPTMIVQHGNKETLQPNRLVRNPSLAPTPSEDRGVLAQVRRRVLTKRRTRAF